MTDLSNLLGELPAALTAARTELDQLNKRRDELLDQIGRAEALLGERARPPVMSSRRQTLHEALADVLRANGNCWMTARELADAINSQRLYEKRDGSPLDTGQVHARTNNYSDVFERRDGKIRLK